MKLMRFKLITLIVSLLVVGAYGQKQSKSYNEVFNVNAETILDINTSNTDIEFETWDKNQISVEAIVEIEGATPEEAEKYFEDRSIEIVGNSQKVEISTRTNNTWLFGQTMEGLQDLQDLNIVIPDFHFEMPEIPEMPDMEDFIIDLRDMPMPPVPAIDFDYEAYKKDGEKYLEKWQKKFQKGFNKDYEKKMEAWSKRMELRGAEIEKRQEERQSRRTEMMKKRMEGQERRMEKQAEAMEKRAAEMEKRVEEREKQRELLEKQHEMHEKEANIFYYSHDGQNKNYKVKKTIKIKMPKGTKIKMNVRHGEVKLAENTKNINAKLSYSSLEAYTIDGDKTIIKTSYSPVSVQKWNYGLLQADYSENVDLREVLNLRLSATSSDVTIDKLLKSLVVNNKMGPLKINSVSKDFKEMDISLQNGEFMCNLPATAFVIEVDGTLSELKVPSSLHLDKTKNHNTTVYKGYNISRNTDKSILINSKYSEVVLKD